VKDGEEEDRWLDPGKTLAEEKVQNNDEVSLKIKYFKQPKVNITKCIFSFFDLVNLPITVLQKLVDEAAIRIFYLQVKQNIINGSYPCGEKLAIRLAAYQVQLSYGNYVPSSHRPGFLG
jgi:hypothetical protein